MLEKKFEQFNSQRPADFCGHSLSVSDVVAVKQGAEISYHYCDSFGFKELDGFIPKNALKNAELSTEDDYGMIDGMINNGRKQQEAEKRPSVLEKLHQPVKEIMPKKTAHIKGADKEL